MTDLKVLTQLIETRFSSLEERLKEQKIDFKEHLIKQDKYFEKLEERMSDELSKTDEEIKKIAQKLETKSQNLTKLETESASIGRQWGGFVGLIAGIISSVIVTIIAKIFGEWSIFNFVTHLKSTLTATSYILELELQIDSLNETLKKLKNESKNSQILIGKLNSEKKKAEALKTDFEKKLKEIQSTYITKTLFSTKVSLLIDILKKQRKFSQDEEERKILEELILVLNKANDDS